MRFTKMHGAGNDYVYIDGKKEGIADAAEWAVRLSDRHFGIGSDGVVLILPSETCDFRMRMYNADGSEAEMCGNASRCIGKYVYDKGLTDKTEITLETKAGVKRLELFLKDGKVNSVQVDMGIPDFAPEHIPTTIEQGKTVGYPVEIGGEIFRLTTLSMGNPHVVIFVEDVSSFPVHEIGAVLEKHSLFPQCTNVEFVEVDAPGLLKMRVWERGAGETLACGTGACASLVAAVLNGFSGRQATLQLSGGNLEIEWKESDGHVYMTGEAATVYEGEIKL